MKYHLVVFYNYTNLEIQFPIQVNEYSKYYFIRFSIN